MAIKRVEIDGIGSLALVKKRGMRNLRLSVTPKGEARVSLPIWAPYQAGIKFAQERADWIGEQMSKRRSSPLVEGAHIGKSRRLVFKPTTSRTASSRVKSNEIVVSTPWAPGDPRSQQKAREACEKALRAEAQQLLPQRLAQLAAKHNYSYETVRIRKLTSRWGSCSSHGVITLSYFLMQLPWELIDYVLLHELLHTKHMHHGPDFWTDFESIMPGAKKIRKQVNAHQPRIVPETLA